MPTCWSCWRRPRRGGACRRATTRRERRSSRSRELLLAGPVERADVDAGSGLPGARCRRGASRRATPGRKCSVGYGPTRRALPASRSRVHVQDEEVRGRSSPVTIIVSWPAAVKPVSTALRPAPVDPERSASGRPSSSGRPEVLRLRLVAVRGGRPRRETRSRVTPVSPAPSPASPARRARPHAEAAPAPSVRSPATNDRRGQAGPVLELARFPEATTCGSPPSAGTRTSRVVQAPRRRGGQDQASVARPVSGLTTTSDWGEVHSDRGPPV